MKKMKKSVGIIVSFFSHMVALSIWDQAVNAFGEQCNDGDHILVKRTVRNGRVTIYSIERVEEQLIRHIGVYNVMNEPLFRFNFASFIASFS